MSDTNEILVFRPNLNEFQHFARYVLSIQPLVTAGICKVIPPAEWLQPCQPDKLNSITINSPARQNVFGAKGIYKIINITERNRTVEEFRLLAERAQPATLSADPTEIARKFWKNIAYDPPLYGGDTPGTLMGDSVKMWNLNNLGTLLDLDFVPKIPGMNTPYLYFGMWKALFALHTEDLDLFSINFLHHGAAKYWYSVPSRYASSVESLAQRCFRDDYLECAQFLRHKTFLLSPTVLAAQGIPCFHTQQNQGEFILTFPQAYHFGFNAGFNCAESTNFALETWLPYGLKAQFCKCFEDTVKLNLKYFAVGPGLCYKEGRATTPSQIVAEQWRGDELFYQIIWKDINESSWERASAYKKFRWKWMREKWKGSQSSKLRSPFSGPKDVGLDSLSSSLTVLVPHGPPVELDSLPSVLVPHGPPIELDSSLTVLVPHGPPIELDSLPSVLVPHGPPIELDSLQSVLGPPVELDSLQSVLVPHGPPIELDSLPSSPIVLVPHVPPIELDSLPSVLVPHGPPIELDSLQSVPVPHGPPIELDSLPQVVAPQRDMPLSDQSLSNESECVASEMKRGDLSNESSQDGGYSETEIANSNHDFTSLDHAYPIPSISGHINFSRNHGMMPASDCSERVVSPFHFSPQPTNVPEQKAELGRFAFDSPRSLSDSDGLFEDISNLFEPQNDLNPVEPQIDGIEYAPSPSSGSPDLATASPADRAPAQVTSGRKRRSSQLAPSPSEPQNKVIVRFRLHNTIMNIFSITKRIE